MPIPVACVAAHTVAIQRSPAPALPSLAHGGYLGWASTTEQHGVALTMVQVRDQHEVLSQLHEEEGSSASAQLSVLLADVLPDRERIFPLSSNKIAPPCQDIIPVFWPDRCMSL